MKKKVLENIVKWIFLLCGIAAVGFVLCICLYLVISGVPAIREIGLWNFLFGETWNAPTNEFGILPFILTSIYGTAGALLLGVPLGLFTAVFLAKAAPPRIAAAARSCVALLAGIPSVVYGLVGMTVLVPFVQKSFSLSSGACLLTAILVLTVMILPYIVSVSETALRAVPREYEEASLALGATKAETWFLVSLKAAKSGVIASVIQGTGRAVGEAMAILMVAGNVANMPSLFASVRFLTTAIVSEMSYAAYGSLQRDALFSVGSGAVPLHSSHQRRAAASQRKERQGMRKLRDIFLKAALIAAAVITGGILLFLIGIIVKRGLPQLSWSFLTTATSYLAGTTGILPNICNTLYLILIAMGAALPLGAGAAVYITEYAENPRVVRLISFAAETLTGIPSILFGLIGMLFFIKLGGLKQGVLAGGLTLALMVLPTVMANTRESLLAVPRAYREGALALGSGKWHMVRTVVLPNAVDGIVTGCILSVGRITGESAALLFTAGFGLRLLGFKAALESSSASLSVALYLYASEQGKFDIAFGIAAVLLVLTLALNLLASLTARKAGKER